MEGPLIGGVSSRATTLGGLAGGLGGALTEGGLAGAGGGLSGARTAGAAGAVALLAGSRIVPHIPQNRKLLELTSPHFGQITGVLRISLFLECNSETAARLRIGGTGESTVRIPNPY